MEPTGSDLLASLLCLALPLLAGMAAFLWLLRRRRARSEPSPQNVPGVAPEISTQRLNQLASRKLVETDNALRTSDQELGFATAQYGHEATRSFGEALASARRDVTRAFRLRQQLDDDQPEDEVTRRAMLQDIVDSCERADRRLDEQADSFSRLRGIEAQADDLLDALLGRWSALRTALPTTQRTSTDLLERYGGTALDTVRGNAQQAESRLDFAQQEISSARQDLRDGRRPPAALRIRAAEQALAQADTLLRGMEKVAEDLRQAEDRLNGFLPQVRSEAIAGRAALESAGNGDNASRMNLAAAVARAQEVMADIEQAMHHRPLDPISALRRLESAAADLDASLSGIRDVAAGAQHARTLLDQDIFTARTNIEAVADFVATRRGAVGSYARTRLAEAQRQLERTRVLATHDPVAALAAADRANNLADEAMAAAEADVSQWSAAGVGPVLVSGMGGAVLGGILVDGVFGGSEYAVDDAFFLTSDEGGVAEFSSERATPGRFGGPAYWTRQ